MVRNESVYILICLAINIIIMSRGNIEAHHHDDALELERQRFRYIMQDLVQFESHLKM